MEVAVEKTKEKADIEIPAVENGFDGGGSSETIPSNIRDLETNVGITQMKEPLFCSEGAQVPRSLESSQDNIIYFFNSDNKASRSKKRPSLFRPRYKAQTRNRQPNPISGDRPKKRIRDDGRSWV
ncbi:hypothetical protein Hanom_Chr07g00607091 [Helianthus anomalus]